MSMILDYFYKYLLKITKTQNFFQKIYIPIQFNNFWWTEMSIFFWLLKTVLAPWAKSYRRGGPKLLRHNKIHYISFNFLFFTLNFLLGGAKIYLVFKLLEGLKYPLSPPPILELKLILNLGQNGPAQICARA